MNDWWFKAQYKWAKQFKRLNDEQLGKFCRALFLYAQTGEIMELDGAEGMLFDIAIDDIEDERQRTDEISKKRSAASKSNKVEQTSTNTNKSEQTHTNGVQTSTNDNKTGNSKELIDKSKDIYTTTTTARAREAEFSVDVDDPEVQLATEAYQLAAQYHLDKFDDNIDAIREDLKTYGAEKVKQALRDAVQSDNRNGISIVYYRTVLKNLIEGKPKPSKSPPARKIKMVTEAAYDQREYEDDSNTLPKWVLERIAADKAAGIIA